MQAAVLERPGQLVLVDRAEPPEPGPGDVLVGVRRVGICGTDHHAFSGHQNFFSYPRVLGHELAVEVLAVGSGVGEVAPGDHCAVLPYLSCGTCPACRRGRPNSCASISVLGVHQDGGLCERMIVPSSHLFADPRLSLDQLVLVETLGIGWHAVARAQTRPDDVVLVIGAGPVGLAVAQAVRPLVARLVLADRAAERTEFARCCGFDALQVGDVVRDPVSEALGGLPTVLFDATGNRQSMEAAFDLTEASGTVVFVGHTRESISFSNPAFHARELDVRASRNATEQDWSGVIAGLHAGGLDASPWINHRTTLEGIVTELPELAADPGRIVKTVVHIGDDPDGSDGGGDA